MPFVFPIMINSKYEDAYLYIPPLVIGTIFNVAMCLYSQIYLAKKMSGKVASTTIIGAIINIVINVLFIKKIGLYAASISTAIAYFIMMTYRHFDLKKYVNIKIDKRFIIETFIIFVFAIILYYKNNIYLNIINLTVVCIYAFITNIKFLKDTYKTIFRKLKRR